MCSANGKMARAGSYTLTETVPPSDMITGTGGDRVWHFELQINNGSWNLKKGANRVNEYYLNAWREIYNEAVRNEDPIAPKLLNPKFKCETDKESVKLLVTKEVMEWMEKTLSPRDNRTYDVWIKGFCRGRKFSYYLIDNPVAR